VVIRVFFAVLVLCTVAVVAVVLAIHLRVKRHLRSENSMVPAPETPEQKSAGVAVDQPETAADTVEQDEDRPS
jgi:hypothetical protein